MLDETRKKKDLEKSQDQLKRIQLLIEGSRKSFKENNDRFHKFQKFVYETSLNEADRATLDATGKPVIEFNILNQYLSRQCGEFSKQEPSIYVKAKDGYNIDVETTRVVEEHIRHILFEARKKNVQYDIYKNQMSGGFGYSHLRTDYEDEMSMDQVIILDRPAYTTMCGFDPIARTQDKSDGNFFFQIFPMTEEEFKAANPDVDIKDIRFSKSSAGFNWSFTIEADGQKIIIVCDFYEKKISKKKIVRLSNKMMMLESKFKEFMIEWNKKNLAEQPPIVLESRMSSFQNICRYRLIEDQIISYTETDFKYFPFSFYDGDSVLLESGGANFKLFTKPYLFHAEGIQRLKNFSGQCIAGDFEDMVQHKFKVAKESIPAEKDYQDAYTDMQTARTFVYNQYDPLFPERQLNPPQEIMRVPIPQEVVSTFDSADRTLQSIIGSYDPSIGVQKDQMSGIAMVESATQSNAAAMPYIVAHMNGLNQDARNIVDLIPKYYVTPRTIPVISKDGTRSYQKINQPGGVNLNYDATKLVIEVEAGVNFAIAKNQALKQLIALMKASPMFAKFINDEGLEVLIDNMEFRGADIVKDKVEAWVKKMKDTEAKAQSQPNPDQMKAQMLQMQMELEKVRLQMQQQKDQMQAQLDAAKLEVDKQNADTNRMKALSSIGEANDQVAIAHDKAQAEKTRAAVDLVMQANAQDHKHLHEKIGIIHSITQDNQQNANQSI